MSRYAERECADCHIILPAPEMISRSGRAIAGRSDTVIKAQPTIDNQYPRSTYATTTHYENYSYYLCRPCYERRKAAIRRLVANVAIAIVLAVAVLLTFVALSPPLRKTAVPPADQPELYTTGHDGEAAGEGVEPLSELGAGSNEATVANQPIQPPPISSDQTGDVEPTSVPSARVLSGAIAAALETGRAISWSAGNKSGQVLVSAPAAITDGECRTISVESQSATWCTRGDGDWRLNE